MVWLPVQPCQMVKIHSAFILSSKMGYCLLDLGMKTLMLIDPEIEYESLQTLTKKKNVCEYQGHLCART